MLFSDTDDDADGSDDSRYISSFHDFLMYINVTCNSDADLQHGASQNARYV